jgi:hypothetical protein
LAQLAHLIITIDGIKQFHKANPVMRGKGLVGTRVKLASNLIDKIPEHGHRAAAKYLNYELEKMTITASALADCQCLSFLAWLPPQIASIQLEQVERVT